MSQNPLQQFFRQPKIYIDLPSKGIYSPPGTIQGDVEKLPVYGMTGMDEILIRTPDALLSGETTAKVIESCVPAIKNAWDMSNLDIDLVLAAIRIATYGHTMTVTHVCPKCSAENDYELDLMKVIEHYSQCQFDNQVIVGNLKITLRPLTYKQVTTHSLTNFQLQKRIISAETIENEEEKSKELATLFRDLGELQNEIYTDGIESIDTGSVIVVERPFIREWVLNSESSVFDAIKKVINANKRTWEPPTHSVKCESCGEEGAISVDLDPSSFFVTA